MENGVSELKAEDKYRQLCEKKSEIVSVFAH